MQAVILAAGRGYRLNKLTENNTKCMIDINGVTLIERMLNQIEACGLDRIVIVDGYKKNNLESFIEHLKICTPITYVFNEDYSETNNIYSLYVAREYLSEDDSIVLESDIIFEDQILRDMLEYPSENVAAIDMYKSWMTGQGVALNEKGEIVNFSKENEIDHNQILSSYKTIGMYKISANFFKGVYQPFLKAYIDVYGKNNKYEQALSVLTGDGKSRIRSYLVGEYNWYEINDIQDIDLASTLFSADEETVTEAMLGRWGGYWRFPKYLDFFYLVTPYYPTSTMIEEMKANFDELLVQYPSGMKVNALLAAKEFMVDPENIVIGNGASELIKSIMTRFSGNTGFIRPTFEEYANRYCCGNKVDYYIENDNYSYTVTDIIEYYADKEISNLVVVNPDNPSGNYIGKNDMKMLLKWAKNRNIKLVIDESFVDFSDEEDSTLIKQSILEEYQNLYVIKSISKSYGIPGLRLGVLATGDKDTILWMKKDVAIWNINSFAEFYMQIAGKYRKDYLEALKKFRRVREDFEEKLKLSSCVRVIPSQANYFMVELLNGVDAEAFKRKMLIDHKIFIKTLRKKIKTNRQYLRIAIRDEKDNDYFVKAMKDVVGKMKEK